MKNLLVAAIVGGLASSCSQDSPTTPIAPNALLVSQAPLGSSPASSDDIAVEEQKARLRAMLDVMSRQPQLTTHEEFTCQNVEEARVRFADPGFIDGLSVGVFVKFIGVPVGTKTLRIWWDYENRYDAYQDVAVGDGDSNPEDTSRFDVEMVVEHGYATPGEKRVRVELILQGQTGNCARNRDIIVTFEPVVPGVPAVPVDHVASFGGVAVCNSFPGRGMGMRVNLSPPIPAGTSYTVSIRVDAVGVLVPTFINASFANAAGPDIVFALPQFTLPPTGFSTTWTTSVPHAQLLIAADIFAFPSPASMNVQVVSITIPGKTIVLNGTISGSCP